MKQEHFEFNELPYQTLARFGLTQEMIEDLPMRVLEEIGRGGYSPVSYTHLVLMEQDSVKETN